MPPETGLSLPSPLRLWLLDSSAVSSFLKLIIVLAAPGFCCCAQAFSSRSEQGLLLLVVRGLLTAVAAFVAEHGLSTWGARAQLPHSKWNLPRSGIESTSPSWESRF